jgi:hypothetical protein
MNLALLIISVVVPVLPVVLFPTRFIGRSMVSTALGAGLLVALMMGIYFSLTALGGAMAGPADTSALGGLTDQDASALDALFK